MEAVLGEALYGRIHAGGISAGGQDGDFHSLTKNQYSHLASPKAASILHFCVRRLRPKAPKKGRCLNKMRAANPQRTHELGP